MPAGGALFGSAAAGPGSTGGNKHLIEVRAGKMNLKGRMVYPDKRKGLLYVYQSDDSLMHFCWQDRTSGIVEDDLIIFPDDCEYVKVPQCTTGRAYLLKFKSSNKKFFFWIQEPKTDKDEDNCKRINELLNNPSSAVRNTSNPDQDIQSLLNNMSQSQLMQLFGSGVGQMGGLSSLLGNIRGPNSGSARTCTTPAITHRTTVPTTPTTTTATNSQSNTTTAPGTTTPQNPTSTATPDAPKGKTGNEKARDGDSASFSTLELADLQNFLSIITPPTGGNGASAATQPAVDLSTALTSETLVGVLNNPETIQQLQSHLPAVDENAQEALRSTLASPQFQQAVSQFSSALESGQLGPIVSGLAVNPEAVVAAAQGSMAEFVKALEKGGSSGEAATSDDKDKEKSEGDKKKKDDEDQMQLD
ncbi:proteasomal ubiquitin receptor ADRM1-B-like isoform X1 [Diorhabda carinulata]|uniref:proteasomal ubiquitin receptor ADRM1-B-like isoform X1 n=1 Tax=Diorhabda carinulata TaxID=1163345 RepID=UPI0025A23AE6|nr:proteasomal ubiquitin receptor ADRM1-B-like isoform X1 [Diorhabda carinulata]